MMDGGRRIVQNEIMIVDHFGNCVRSMTVPMIRWTVINWFSKKKRKENDNHKSILKRSFFHLKASRVFRKIQKML